MKFTFDRDAMIKEISVAQEIITNKSPVSILSTILLIAEDNALTIKATGISIFFITKLPIDLEEGGTTTICCDKFMGILTSLPPGEVEFFQEDIEVTIKPISKRFKAKIKSQTSDKFPEVASCENAPFFEVPASDFKEMIKQTIFAVSTDAHRYFMTGCHLENYKDTFTMVSTDGRRLSYYGKKEPNIPDFNPVTIPTKILGCILKHAPDEGNIQIAIIENLIDVRFGNVEFSSSLIEAQYPNYQRVIPTDLNSSLQVNKKDLEEALKRTTVMIDRKVQRIIIKIKPGELELICPESESGEADEIIPCRYDGQPVSLALNYTYLTEPLKVIDSEYVEFNFYLNEATDDEEACVSKPVIIKGSGDVDYLHVVMPMNF